MYTQKKYAPRYNVFAWSFFIRDKQANADRKKQKHNKKSSEMVVEGGKQASKQADQHFKTHDRKSNMYLLESFLEKFLCFCWAHLLFIQPMGLILSFGTTTIFLVGAFFRRWEHFGVHRLLHLFEAGPRHVQFSYLLDDSHVIGTLLLGFGQPLLRLIKLTQLQKGLEQKKTITNTGIT